MCAKLQTHTRRRLISFLILQQHTPYRRLFGWITPEKQLPVIALTVTLLAIDCTVVHGRGRTLNESSFSQNDLTIACRYIMKIAKMDLSHNYLKFEFLTMFAVRDKW